MQYRKIISQPKGERWWLIAQHAAIRTLVQHPGLEGDALKEALAQAGKEAEGELSKNSATDGPEFRKVWDRVFEDWTQGIHSKAA